MSREFSIYLDLVRFAAALLVLVSHSNDRSLSATPIPFGDFGHSAVVIFFVLSGFVIAYVTDTKEHDPRQYALSRMARIYSVALPALLLTLVLDLGGEALQPALYVDATTHDWWLLRFLTSSLFLNEFWWISITAYSNVPYWSLNYEVWYYILFGLFVFWRGTRRNVVLLLAALLAGPKILLLLPIWLLGVWLYRGSLGWRLQTWQGIAIFIVSLILLALFHVFDVDKATFDWLKSVVGAKFHEQMTWSRHFISDYLLGLIVLLNFVGFRVASKVLGRPLLSIEKPIRTAAGFTLSIYLFHRPLIYFFTALFNGDPRSAWPWPAVVGSTILACVILGLLTEHRKDDYRRLFERVLAKVEQFALLLKTRLLPS